MKKGNATKTRQVRKSRRMIDELLNLVLRSPELGEEIEKLRQQTANVEDESDPHAWNLRAGGELVREISNADLAQAMSEATNRIIARQKSNSTSLHQAALLIRARMASPTY